MKFRSMGMVTFLSMGIAAIGQASIRDNLPRSVQCNGFPDYVTVGLGSVTAGDDVTFDGRVVDNYTSARFQGCQVAKDVIFCTGTWAFHDRPATLTITPQSDGTFKGQLLNASGKLVTLGCLLSHNSLSFTE